MLDGLLFAVGWSYAEPHGDGVWRQRHLPYTLRTDAPTWEVGYRWGKWSAGYTQLVRTSSDAYALTNDVDYSPATGTCLANCEQIGRFQTEGKVDGLYLRREWQSGGWLVEAGVLVFRPQHVVRISDFRSRYPDGTPYGPVAAEYVNKAEVGVTPSIGVGFAFNPMRYMLRFYPWVKSSGDRKTADGTSFESLTSLYSGPVITMSVEFTF